MKKLVALVVIAAVMALGVPANAAKVWDDMSWWGNTGATPDPVADSKGRSGYWWWPTEPASNVDDMELWGNRGIVYHIWTPEVPELAPPPPPPPTPDPPPPPTRTAIILNHVLFDFDKAVLKPEGKAEVDKLIAEMKKFPGDAVVIEGHTCSVGPADYNMGLGQRRADAVKKYIVDNGIDVARIETVSYGLTRPAVPNDTPANRRLNRRAEFKITLDN